MLSPATLSPPRERRTPDPERSDAELIRDCLAGRESGWDALVDRYVRLVYSIALKRGLSTMDADDLVQDVFVLVYRRLETLRDADRFAPWLIRVSHREAGRRKRTISSEAGLEALPDTRDLPDDELRRLEDQQLVRRAIKTLSQRDQALIHALFFEGRQAYADVAARLGVPVGSLGPTRARALKRLEQALASVGFEPDCPREQPAKPPRGTAKKGPGGKQAA